MADNVYVGASLDRGLGIRWLSKSVSKTFLVSVLPLLVVNASAVAMSLMAVIVLSLDGDDALIPSNPAIQIAFVLVATAFWWGLFFLGWVNQSVPASDKTGNLRPIVSFQRIRTTGSRLDRLMFFICGTALWLSCAAIVHVILAMIGFTGFLELQSVSILAAAAIYAGLLTPRFGLPYLIPSLQRATNEQAAEPPGQPDD